RAPMKSIRAAPLRACPIRWNISLTLAGIVFEPVGIAAVLERQLSALPPALPLPLLQTVVVGDAALTLGGAGRQAKDQHHGEGGPHTSTRQPDTSAKAPTEGGR